MDQDTNFITDLGKVSLLDYSMAILLELLFRRHKTHEIT